MNTSPAIKIPSGRLYQKIALDLAARISDGAYGASGRLPTERRIAEEFDVSRTTVREALLALELMGVVEIRGRSGIYIIERGVAGERFAPTVDFGASLDESLELRLIIEVELVARAAMHASDMQLEAISSALARGWQEFAKGTYDQPHPQPPFAGDPDCLFHFEIARAAQNTIGAHLIRQLWNALRTPLAEAAENRVQIAQYAELSLLDHDRILAALCAHDADAAKDAMTRHLQRYRTIINRPGQRHARNG